MSHNRTKIRNAITDKLKGDAPLVALVPAKNIYNARILQLPKTLKSAISVYTFDETAAKTASEDDLIRIQNAMIVVWMTGKDGATIGTGEQSVDDKLDDVLKAVEDIFLNKYENLRSAWPTGERPPFRMNYTETKLQQDITSEEVMVIATMKFDVELHQELPQVP